MIILLKRKEKKNKFFFFFFFYLEIAHKTCLSLVWAHFPPKANKLSVYVVKQVSQCWVQFNMTLTKTYKDLNISIYPKRGVSFSSEGGPKFTKKSASIKFSFKMSPNISYIYYHILPNITPKMP